MRRRDLTDRRVPGTGLFENIGGAFRIAAVLASPFLSGLRSRWGATPAEIARSYPGDDIIARTRGRTTVRAVTVDAPLDEVWPWIHQIGQRRGGFYTYERLENMAGCQITNVDQLLPDLAKLAVDDCVYLHPEMPPQRVALCDPPRTLVLHGLSDTKQRTALRSDDPRPEVWYESVWSFHLFETDGDRTRLISRSLYDHSGGFGNALTDFLIGNISFVMERSMLLNLRKLVVSARA